MRTTVTFIPGMFNPFINTFLGTYFIDQMEYLDRRDVPYSILPVHTEGSIEVNARTIYEELQDKENVVAFGHSKGGVDLLHALIRYPELRSKFRKIVFMQCPFYGTPLADFALQSEAGTLATKGLFRILLRGDIDAIKELSQKERSIYMLNHASSIQEIISLIEIECIGSAKLPERGRFDSILKIPRDFIQYKFKLPNDGMIPMESALIKGSKTRVYNDLDHASAVIRLTPQFFDRRAFSHEVFAGAL